eukprot:4562561-Lingulodinium_polyedra.AAC.1
MCHRAVSGRRLSGGGQPRARAPGNSAVCRMAKLPCPPPSPCCRCSRPQTEGLSRKAAKQPEALGLEAPATGANHGPSRHQPAAPP